jgi:hypothetical protein
VDDSGYPTGKRGLAEAKGFGKLGTRGFHQIGLLVTVAAKVGDRT